MSECPNRLNLLQGARSHLYANANTAITMKKGKEYGYIEDKC